MIVLTFLVSALAALGLWAWWFVPKEFVDTVRHVASTRPLAETFAATPLVKSAVPLAADLSQREGVDWPSFLGPTGDGHTTDARLKPWSTQGPKIVWTAEIGEGYAAPSVVRGRVIVFDRINNEVRCRCMHSDTGQELWQFRYPTDYRDKQGYDGGPRASPVSDGARVYLYGPEGMLHCLRLEDGQLLWKINILATFGVVQNIFGVGSTPLIDGDKLLVQVGGSPPGSTDKDFMSLKNSGSCIVAFDKASGQVLYQCGQDLASYASPQVVTLQGQRTGLVFARGGVVGFDPETGVERFRYPYRARSYNAVNASNLVVQNDRLFVTESYEIGCVQLKVNERLLEQTWAASPRKKDQGVCCHWSTPVLIDGHLYGCTSRHRNDAEIRCVEWATGKVKWTAKPALKDEVAGRGSLITANGYLFYFVEEGWLFMIKAQASGYEQAAVWDAASAVPTLKYPCWAGPVLARGQLYLRGKGCVMCVDVGGIH
ncbi:MAG: PQQ-binding-like beta-propeller repeat protein [Gemmatales bacterium]